MKWVTTCTRYSKANAHNFFKLYKFERPFNGLKLSVCLTEFQYCISKKHRAQNSNDATTLDSTF